MPSPQIVNPAMADILTANMMPNRFANLHEPIGDYGVWNGQFELGPIDDNPIEQPEGWEVTAFASGEGTRVVGGFAGSWCYKGGQAGNGKGVYMLSLRYIPVSGTVTNYQLTGAFKGSSVNTTISFGVVCYDNVKAAIMPSLPLSVWTPGIAWTTERHILGPAGTALFANTRYVRVYIELSNTTLAANYAYVDDVQFQQIKEVYHEPYVCLQDVKAKTTDGGGFTNGAWRTRDLNTEQADADGICTLAANQFVLDAGTYRCYISAPAHDVDGHQAILYNVTGAATVLTGTSEYCWATDAEVTRSVIIGEFTIAAAQTLEVRHQCQTTKAVNGFGIAVNLAGNEIYTVAQFRQVRKP